MMRVVIVGAGYAGLTCALRLARKARGRAQITLVNGSAQFVERIRLHEQASGRPRPVLALNELVRGTDVQLALGWVQAIDLAQRTLCLGEQTLTWDHLVLALGSEVDDCRVPGAAEHAFTLEAHSTPWLEAALPAIASRRGRMVVVGGGLTGIEAATEFAERYPDLRVALVTRGTLAPDCTPAAREHVRACLRRLGVELREGVAVERVDADRLHTDGGEIPFSACVWSAGFRAPALARDAGLAVDARGQVLVDAALRAADHPHVHVAGDLASPQGLPGAPMPMGCKSAFPTGMHVADNLARLLDGQHERAFSYRAVPYCISLGRHDAVLQLPMRCDGHSPRSLRGKPAAFVKEAICRGTVWALLAERQASRIARLLSFRSAPLLAASEAEDARA